MRGTKVVHLVLERRAYFTGYRGVCVKDLLPFSNRRRGVKQFRCRSIPNSAWLPFPSPRLATLRTRRSRLSLSGGHHSPIQGPEGLTVALRLTGLTNLLYEVASASETYPACGLSTPKVSLWSLPPNSVVNAYDLLCSNALEYFDHTREFSV
jgi:hypothetical protein